jgi:hypothetical protein
MGGVVVRCQAAVVNMKLRYASTVGGAVAVDGMSVGAAGERVRRAWGQTTIPSGDLPISQRHLRVHTHWEQGPWPVTTASRQNSKTQQDRRPG